MPHTDSHPKLSPKQIDHLLERYRVTKGKGFRLSGHATDDPASDLIDRDEAETFLEQGVERLSRMQERLYADATWSLLIIVQAMDAAGKDSTIKHVTTGVNPQGVMVTSFKAPGPEDLAHDFLWRINRALPARGMIGIFNRSHYEEVLVTRVHPELLDHQRLPAASRDGKPFWNHRLKDIRAFERHLGRSGTRVLKFFLHVSRDEQKKRFLARLDEPEKNWKFNAGDIRERAFWDDYMKAYEAAIGATATEDAPWYVVPADQKWFTRLVVVEAINATLAGLDLKWPETSPEAKAQLAEARGKLEAENGRR